MSGFGYDVLVGFSVNKETTAFLSQPLEAGCKIPTRFVHTVGGTSADIAIALTRTFGITTKLLGGVAKDPRCPVKATILALLQDAGVEFYPLANKRGTSDALVIIQPDGSAAIAGDRTPWEEFPMEEVRRQVVLCRPRIVIASGVLAEEYMLVEALFSGESELRVLNPRISLLEERELIERLADRTHLLFLNHIELGAFLGRTVSEEKVTENDVRRLLDLGAGAVIVTCNRHGAYYFDKQTCLFQPSINFGELVDATGAGDSFLSGFVAAYRGGRPLAERMRWGATMAGLKVLNTGGSNVPTGPEFLSAATQMQT